MNELPVIGSLRLRKDFLDRHGANTASCYEEIYDRWLFRRPKKTFWIEIDAFLLYFYHKWIR